MTTINPTRDSIARLFKDNSVLLIKIVMVLAILTISVSAPLVLNTNRIVLLVLGLVGVAGLWFILRWPAVGLLALIITALLVPSPYLPGGLNFAVILLIALIGLWLLVMITNRRVTFLRSRPILPLVTLLVVSLLSFAFGQLDWFPLASHAPLDAQIGGLLIFVLSVGAFLLAAHQTTIGWLKVLTFAFVGLGGLFILGWIFPPIGVFSGRYFQDGATANSLFWTWLVALALGQALFNNKLNMGWRVLLLVIVATTLYVGYFKNSGWKSGYIPPLVAVAAIVGARSWRVGLVVGLAAIVPAVMLSNQAFATDEYSYLTRVDAWLIMLEIIKVSPILGLGPANYYWYTPLFPIRGYAVQFNSHNQYIDIAAQTGLLGLLCFLWFGAEMAWLSFSLRDKAPQGFAQAYVYGAIGGLAGSFAAAMLADWVLPFVYNIGLAGMRGSIPAWIFLGGVVAIEQATKLSGNVGTSSDSSRQLGELV